KNPQIPLPLLEPIQRVMVRADVAWRRLAARRAIEHAAQPDAVHDAAMHATPHDATRAVVHHDEYPMGPQDRRLAAEQVETPQTVLRVTEHGEPGRPRRVWLRSGPRGENAAHDILVDGNVESQVDLLRDPWAPPLRISPCPVDDGGTKVAARSPRPRLLPCRGREQKAIFPRLQRPMKAQEGRGLQHDRGTDQPRRTHQERADAGNESIGEAEIRRAFTRPIDSNL